MEISKDIVFLEDEMKGWRHHFHAFPEIAFQEWETSDFLAGKLGSFGFDVHRRIGKTGIVAQLVRGKGLSRAVGLRADMDALEIQEENDLVYRSKVSGKMHACGHDGHMAMLLGAAKHLAAKGRFSGTVNLIFQPAEETASGAKAMIEERLFQRFPMDCVFGLHNFPGLPEGAFATRTGPMMAAYDTFDIIIKGVGGHAGGMASNVRDPIVAAAQVIGMFQSIVSRNINPIEAAVLSVTETKGGTAYNVIPDKVLLRGCTRYFQPVVQSLLEERMREVLKGLETAMGVGTDFKYHLGCPAVVNCEKETEQALNAALAFAGKSQVFPNIPPVMNSEDFAFMLNEVPGSFLAIGAGQPLPNGMPHQAGYDFNDNLLSIGAAYWVRLVEALLPAE